MIQGDFLTSPSPVFIPQPVGTTASYGYFDVVDDGQVISPPSNYYAVEAYEYRDGRWLSSADGGRFHFSGVEYLSWDTGSATVRAVRFEVKNGRWRLRNLGNAPIGKYAFTFSLSASVRRVVVVYMGLGISEW